MRNITVAYCSIRKWSTIRRLCLIFLLGFLFVCFRSPFLDDGQSTDAGVDGWNLFEGSVSIGENRFRDRIKRDSDRERKFAAVDSTTLEGSKNKISRKLVKAVHLGLVACGERIEEPLMMLKSAVVFGREPLHVHVFTDDGLWSKFSESLEQWQRAINWRSFSYSLYLTNFPADQADEWRRLFKLCASQRLFIPDLLRTTDALLYVDTDVLFLRPPEDLWSHFKYFNANQIAALSPETEEPTTNWYVRFARHPFYKPLGVNSGVMLMNLTRMREFRWSDHLTPILLKYRYNITWGDQDIINIIFSDYPEKLYIFGCDWNYRPDHCMYTSTCESAEEFGVSILHGSRGYFRMERQPTFRAVYEAIKKYKFGTDLRAMHDSLKAALFSTSNTTCGALYDLFLKRLEAYISSNPHSKP